MDESKGDLMTEPEKAIITKYDLYFESRLTKVETESHGYREDIKEIKSDLRWIMGILFAFNSTILGLMAKGFWKQRT